MAIELPIQRGQKFLSKDEVGEVVSITRKNIRCVVWIGEISGDIRLFHSDGKVDCGRVDNYDLQPIPATIEEGVEFCGEQYRSEFERLTKEGREFEFVNSDDQLELNGKLSFSAGIVYRLLPQHRDVVDNPLTVGNRVEYRNTRCTVSAVDGQILINEFGNPMRPSDCRLLTTRKRPLCKKDLEKASHPSFLNSFGSLLWPTFAGDVEVIFGHDSFKYQTMIDRGYQWRPSADQPWQPCEVTEEVLA